MVKFLQLRLTSTIYVVFLSLKYRHIIEYFNLALHIRVYENCICDLLSSDDALKWSD